jgi:hypothetical protein
MEFSEDKNCAPSMEEIVASCNDCSGWFGRRRLAGFNVCNEDTVHEMVSMFETLDLWNPEFEVSQEDVEEWIDAG